MLTFTTAIPPTINHAHRPNGRGGKLRTEATKAFMQEAGWEARLAACLSGWRYTEGARLELRLRLYFPDARRRDISNAVKVVEDAIAQALGFDDRMIDRLVVERGPVDRVVPRCEVQLMVIGAALALVGEP